MNRRFAQEARLQAKIDHPNVCKVYEVVKSMEKISSLCKFIAGKTLRDAAKELKLEEKLRSSNKLLKHYILHTKKVSFIVKSNQPTSWLWKPKKNLAAVHFGFRFSARTRNSGLTLSGIVVGTPHYMAPEQARGDTTHLDRRTDVYGLGQHIWIVVRSYTVSGKSSAEVLIRVLQEDPDPIRKIDPSIPIDLETIVMKCMQKEPQQRYQSAKELYEDLQRYLDGDPITARPVRLS